MGDIFLIISTYSILPPLVVGLIFYKKLNTNLKLLNIFLWFCLAIELGSHMLIAYKTSNLFLSHIYVPVEFIFISWIYQRSLNHYFTVQWLRTICAAFVAFCIFNILFIQSIWELNNYPRALESLIMIIYSLFYFYKIFQEAKIKYLEKEYLFWLSVGVLVYFSGSLFIFIFSNFMIGEEKIYRYYIWEIHGALNILLHITFTIAIWIFKK